MNKYSEMSDFEVNDEVVESLGLYHLMYYSYDPYFIIWDVASNDLYNGFTSKKGHEFNPCNDKTIAFQLMIDNKLDLDFNPLTHSWSCRKLTHKNYFSSLNENPCRAIAECFLLIKDAEKDNE
ncbi:hypothetical protein [Orbus mooreae]|uniref:hypothetical protein n=1 Tax=Orbus mooreae TaxID=3074107 RepID=UPI00370D1F03